MARLYRALFCTGTVILSLFTACFFIAGQKYDYQTDLEPERVVNGDRALRNSIFLKAARWGNVSNPAVENIGILAIRNEIKKNLLGPSMQKSPNPRAAFENVVTLSSLHPRITSISRMKTPTPETFRNYIAPIGLPVIFTDMLQGHKLKEWTWDYVRSKWGKTVYQNIRQGNFSTKTSKNGKHYVNRVTITLEDFIDIVTGRRKPSKEEEGMYIAKKRVIPVEALKTEFYYPPFYPGDDRKCYLEPTGW